jgi:hypothetical protein
MDKYIYEVSLPRRSGMFRNMRHTFQYLGPHNETSLLPQHDLWRLVWLLTISFAPRLSSTSHPQRPLGRAYLSSFDSADDKKRHDMAWACGLHTQRGFSSILAYDELFWNLRLRELA